MWIIRTSSNGTWSGKASSKTCRQGHFNRFPGVGEECNMCFGYWLYKTDAKTNMSYRIMRHQLQQNVGCIPHTGLCCFFLCLSESVCHLCSRTWVPLRRKPMAAGDPRLEDLCSRLRRPQYMTLRVLESEALNKIQQAAHTHLPLNLPLDLPLDFPLSSLWLSAKRLCGWTAAPLALS
jgi:hypothetical protein